MVNKDVYNLQFKRLEVRVKVAQYYADGNTVCGNWADIFFQLLLDRHGDEYWRL